MSDIFISYARSTAAQAQQIAEALRTLGYGVWRDDELPAHRSYTEVIQERLGAAKAVVVVWSAEAARSEWVQSEADRARADRKLVQLTVDGAQLPMPFDRIQCADLAGWAGDAGHAGWRKVLDSVAQLAGAGANPAGETSQPAVARMSICVLPFANISDDPQQEYFSDGISEDIITDLSKVSALSVVSRNTAFSYKGRALPITQVARELGVSHVLEGSVRKAGQRVRITAQLIAASADSHLWAERWDRDLDDIFALQDEISEAIVAALKLKLLPAEKQAIERRGTANAEAYNLVLMARRHSQSQMARRRELTIRLCRRALELDPGYALAWAQLAVIQSSMASDSAAAVDLGWEAVDRALTLDPNLADAHAAKARLLSAAGRLDEALIEIEVALRLDPGSTWINRSAGSLAVASRRYAEGARHFELASAGEDSDFASPSMAMQCHLALGDHARAKAAAREGLKRAEAAIAADPGNGAAVGYGVTALVTLGEMDKAKAWVEQALLIDPDDLTLRYNLGCAMAKAGETDFALDRLEETLVRGGRGNLEWARNDSDLDSLRDHPRFQAMMAEAEARFATG